ncbi:protein of unknown function [Pseudodesulfovibrio profundus]|uniref:Uncharacterized protein n=1 Tax=Pseudodesulfovibrio profundus TaxID=57320 RepID=A0A2C8F522_9BACT|nr:hypothetical protein [Pseudodesulfovibrio profundus]SOB57187.1 protein of unknown function [Pseudodesulfovibrio profundus]
MNKNITFANDCELTDILIATLENEYEDYDCKMEKLLDWCEQETGLQLQCITEYAEAIVKSTMESRRELGERMNEFMPKIQLLDDLRAAYRKEVERLKGELDFSDFDEVVSVLTALEYVKQTDSELAAVAFGAFCSMAPGEIKEMIDDKLAEMFPGIQPTHHDSQGNVFYSLGNITNELNVSVEEINTMINKGEIEMIDGRKLSSISTNN